jgi:hypothetical protein
VVRDGDRLDGRGSGGDAPAVAGAHGRLVVSKSLTPGHCYA